MNDTFNRVVLCGDLISDPELDERDPDNPTCRMRMVVKRHFMDPKGERRLEPAFLDVVSYGRKAVLISRSFRSGQRILVEGRLRTERWNDRQTGEAREKIAVVLDQFIHA